MINLNSDIPIIGVKSDIAVVSIKPDSICTIYTGATTGIQNVGNGEGIIYKGQLGTKSLIRTIKQGNNITVETSGDTITINGIDSDNLVEVDDFIAHTGDTTIHYKQSGITINENQVNGLIGKYSLTGHTHSKENLIGLKIADSPEFADTKLTTLTSVTSGGTIPDTQWTWLNATSKSVLSSLSNLISYIYNRKDEDLFYYRRINEPFNPAIKLDRDVTQYINYTLTGDTTLSIASYPTPVVEATAEGVLIGNGIASLLLSGITYWATSPEFDKTLNKQNHFMIWKQGDGVYIFITQKN